MKTTRKKEWFDDDTFWRELYPFMSPKQRFVEATAQRAITGEQARGYEGAKRRPRAVDASPGPSRHGWLLGKAA